jgi:alanyl-tRNA synthetase
MTSSNIRKQFISFFQQREHKVVPSAPSVPHGDPTLMFTNAGMNQFKDVFLGSGSRDYSRAVDTQKCIRVSGKHNDLEEVGVDHYHHTFFEMLGNWSFGDYYKAEAIKYAWELLTDVWQLDQSRLYATVYTTDDESYDIWKNYLPEERILRFGDKDNFWEMGDTGPCGPSSEIHYDGTDDKSGKELVNAGHEDVIEIWNLVFIEFNRQHGGELEPLSRKHVDTGMGFERITRILQGKSSNYDTDIFEPLLKSISKLSGNEYNGSDSSNDIAFRVIADHIRALCFSVADGAIPGSDGRGYVLRRILRRASRYGSKLGMNEPFLYKLIPVLASSMGEVFPEIIENKETIEKIIHSEEKSFLQTLEKGLAKFEELTSDSNTVSGSDVFLLYDTFGFPADLTALLGRERNISVDLEGFDRYMQDQKERSRSARKIQDAEVDNLDIDIESRFIGYDYDYGEGQVRWASGKQIAVDNTPFYAEKGGQISDKGQIIHDGKAYEVVSVKSNKEAIVIELDKDYKGSIGDKVEQKIDNEKRIAIKRNHSATHLLHAALEKVLGSHIQQQGSLVTDSYLRFDYNHYEKPSSDQLSEIESMVNTEILKNSDVITEILSLDEAQNRPEIKQFFGDKYGSEVRAVSMGRGDDSTFSVELCGGTHVSNTAEIGLFLITSESSIASGIRRIEAVTGEKVYHAINELREDKNKLLSDISGRDKNIRDLEKEIKKLSTSNITDDIDTLIEEAQTIGDVKIATVSYDELEVDQLRELGDNLRNKLGDKGVGLLSTTNGDKIMLVCVSTDGIKKQLPAGKIVGEAAKRIGGGGGGKPHMATAGGRDKEKLPELMESGILDIVKDMLKG